jgi:hypothetical protein
MDVVSSCPLRVASIVWQPWAGAWALTIVCRATFRIEPGVCSLAEAQEDPRSDDAPWDGGASLHAPSDLVPLKPRADVLLVGHAFAPGGQPARVLTARMEVGAIDKSVEVWCDRIFWQDGRLLEGQPFTRMPLRYERAAGGPANPVGVRFDAPPDAHGAVRIPNLQPPGARVARRGDVFGPIGLGPIGSDWPERVEKLRHHAASWSRAAWRERPLPRDLDAAYFNAAPRDQQLDAIEGDERIVLENLHPEHARLETRLPGLRPTARMIAGSRAGEGIALRADTLWIDTDRALVAVVWRGRVPLNHPGEAGQVVVSLEAEPEGTQMLGAGEGERAPALPFAASGEIETMPGARKGAHTLPFAPRSSPWASAPSAPPSSKPPPVPAETGTLYGAKVPSGEVLPFAAPAISPAPAIPIASPAAPPAIAPEPIRAVAAEIPAPAPPAPAGASPITEIPIERCAAIAASIARRRADTARILEASALDVTTWAALSRRWKEAIRAETARGKTKLLRAYDAAYVARLEEERGQVSVDEYARLVIAAERGEAEDALEALSLPRGAMMRIERVWLARIAADPALGARVRRAVIEAREA